MLHPLDESLDNPVSISGSVWPVVLKFGLIGASIGISIDLLSFLLGTTETNSFDYGFLIGLLFLFLVFALYMLIMFFAVREYRDKHNGGFISLWKGTLVAYITGVVISFTSLAFRLLYFFVLDPEYMERITRESLGDLSPSVYSFSATQIIISQLSGVVLGLLAGALFAFIISAVLQRHKPRIV